VLNAVEETISPGGRSVPACWLALSDAEGNRRTALFWFETRWGTSTSEMTLKLDLLRSSVSRRPTDAALVRLSTDAESDGDPAAKKRILDFLDAFALELDRGLPFAQQKG
jgi:hypothetical protein